MNDKITQQHLDRAAYVYVRQSSGHQVRHHHQGRQRQYDLAERARQLGFARVEVIDDDQGKTGSGMVERAGFATLLAAVCSGEVGAVLALEASRLARNNRDWYHLIDLCALTDTLIVDGEGIYDPRAVNDRLLLGLKGTMSEFELSLFRQRAREAFEMKAAAGHAMWEVPVGFTRDEQDRIEKIADRQVQAAIESVFKKVRQVGSARQTALWFRDNKTPLPEAVRGTRSQKIVWRLPTETRIRQILKNPCYAGALAYGRTEAKVTVEGGRARKSNTRTHKPQEKWKLLLLDNHDGYITWREFQENLSMLESNAGQREPSARGAAKQGTALLGGLLRCSHCGRKLFVGYGKNKTQPRYLCHGGRQSRGSASCQSLGGVGVDRAVSDAVLQAIEPAGIEAAIEAMKQFGHEHDERRRLLELSLEKARYEVDRARRQYDEVDPANRLVASELEARWNTALQRAAELEQQLDAVRHEQVELSDAEQVRLLELGRDLPSLWNHESAGTEMKKRILRTVLEEIMIGDDESRTHHLLVLHWKGGVHTEMSVVLRHAARSVPFYQERFRAAGVDPAQKLTPELWEQIPLLIREEVQQAGSDMVSRQLPGTHGRSFEMRTSGSTGRPVKLKTTELSQLFWRAFTLRDHLWHRRDFAGKLAVIRDRSEKADPPDGQTAQSWGPATSAVFTSGPSFMLNLKATVDQQLDWLSKHDPDYLLTYPTILRELIRRAQKRDIRLSRLRGVSTLGELLPEDVRQLCREAWGLPLSDTYSAKEAGYLALQCPDHEHYHIQAENVLLEILNDQNQPCRPGEVGRVVVTTLNNFATPLIRYVLGDYAQPGTPCPCGRGLPVLSKILGRVRNMVRLPDGQQRYPLLGTKKYHEIAPVRQLQIVQHSLEAIEMKLVVAAPLSQEQEEQLCEVLGTSLGHPFRIELTYHDEIPRSAGGKFEDFRCEV